MNNRITYILINMNSCALKQILQFTCIYIVHNGLYESCDMSNILCAARVACMFREQQMPNGLQMWSNVITGPLCVDSLRALKWINPTDMFSSPATPASHQITHKDIISSSADRWALPGDSWKTTRSSPLSSIIKVLFHKHRNARPDSAELDVFLGQHILLIQEHVALGKIRFCHSNGHFPKHTGLTAHCEGFPAGILEMNPSQGVEHKPGWQNACLISSSE